MTKLKSGTEVEIYYFICFILCFFYMVLCRHMLRKSQSSHVIFSFLFLFVCALDVHCFRIIPRRKPELILENHHFTRWECGNMCQNEKKDETLFHARLLPSVFTKWTLFSHKIIWLHVKRVTWVKDRTVTLRNWTCRDSCTENEFMSIISDFFPFQLGQGNHFQRNMYYGALGDCKQPPGL